MNEEKSGILSQSFMDKRVSSELARSQFKQYGKENFQYMIEKEISYTDFLNLSMKLFSFGLPHELGERLISEEVAKYFWICDSPLLHTVEEYLREGNKAKGLMSENFNEIKKFFLKWAVEKVDNEKDYYALSALQLIDRNTNKHNFIKFIFAALIYIYDNKFFSLEKAIQSIDNCKNALDDISMDESIKKQLFYQISIYEGLIHLRVEQFEEANTIFNDAINQKSNPVSAIYYSIITEKKMGNYDVAAQGVNKLLNFDVSRFSYAIKNNNFGLYTYLFENAVIYSLFKNIEFAELYQDIRATLDAAKSDDHTIIQKVGKWIDKLEDLKLSEYYNTSIEDELNFFKQISKNYSGNKNSFFLILHDNFTQKFNGIVEQVKNQIKTSLKNQVEEELEYYEDYVKTEEDKSEAIRQEISETKESLLGKLNEMKNRLERKYDSLIFELEKKLDDFDSKKKYDPTQSFSSAMVNNAIVSLIIVFVGGFLGGVGDGGGLSDIIPNFFSSGLKWGGIVFMLGFVISLMVSFSVKQEGLKERKRLVKKLADMRNQKEADIEKIRRDHDKKVSVIEQNSNERLTDFEARTQKARDEKHMKEMELIEKSERKRKDMFKKLDAIFS